jgi:hypothetical protein
VGLIFLSAYKELDQAACDSAPSQAEISLNLTTRERVSGLQSGSINWITTGIAIETAQ